LHDTATVLQYTDPTEWAALPKAALVLSGLCPSDPREELAKRLDRLGGGMSGGQRAAEPHANFVASLVPLACLELNGE